ncbi:GIY-YIG nuclease family protein [Thermodesulfobacteriota bacterium]
MITLYVLKGKTGKRYVGITNDLPRRLREHQSHRTKCGELPGEFFVLHTETFPDYESARERGEILKCGQGRHWIDELELAPEVAKRPLVFRYTLKVFPVGNFMT